MPSRTPENARDRPAVRAAGGVVRRSVTVADEAGATRPSIEIVLVHRPRYDDWTFPKGKLDKGGDRPGVRPR
jgi:8-oxo-dGTP pyrophosphatase MutT (NUDIX family)